MLADGAVRLCCTSRKNPLLMGQEQWPRKCHYNRGWWGGGVAPCSTWSHGINLEKTPWVYKDGYRDGVPSCANPLFRREWSSQNWSLALMVDLFQQAVRTPESRLYKFQEAVKKVTGFTTPVVWARGVFNYDFGLMPWRREINTVGKSLPDIKVTL